MKKPTKRTKFLSKLSLNQLRATIVVLCVAILGVWTLILSSAATPVGVNFVLLCPPSGYTCSGSTTTLSSYASQIKTYYQNRLNSGGRTFVLRSVAKKTLPAPPSTWTGSAISYYNGGVNCADTDDACYAKYTARLAWGLGISPNDASNPVKTVVMTGFHVWNHWGVSQYNGAMAVGDPIQGGSSYEAQVLAHELGHSFGLAYNGNYPIRNSSGTIIGYDDMHRNDGSLMHRPAACDYKTLSNCPLNSTDRSYLLNNRLAWFPVQSTSTTTTTASTTNPYTAYCGTGSEATVGYGYTTSGNCVKKLQWDLNKIQNAGLTVDGSFGSLTKSAVVKFQSNHGLTADGICGRNTWSKLDTYYK